MCPKSNRHKACNHFPKITAVLTETEMGPEMGLLVWTPLISQVLMLPRQQHLTKISYKFCQNKKKWYVIERNNNNKKSALVKIISDILCTNVVHYRASGILLITMQLYLFNFFARFECVFHANKNILWFISLTSFVFHLFKRWINAFWYKNHLGVRRLSTKWEIRAICSFLWIVAILKKLKCWVFINNKRFIFKLFQKKPK